VLNREIDCCRTTGTFLHLIVEVRPAFRPRRWSWYASIATAAKSLSMRSSTNRRWPLDMLAWNASKSSHRVLFEVSISPRRCGVKRQ